MAGSTRWYDYLMHLIENCFGPCGLIDDILNYLEDLPESLDESLTEVTKSKLKEDGDDHLPKDLVRAALKWACEKAKSDSEKFGKDYCYYLSKYLKEGHITEYIKNLREAYY